MTSPPQERRSGPPQAAHAVTDSATVAPEYDGEWRQRLAERVARVQARVEARRALRADLKAARDAGKAIRHARRLGGAR